MTEPDEVYRKQAEIIEMAIRKCLELDELVALPVGWFLTIATRDMDNLGQVAHRYFAPEGQPAYASIGLLMSNLDALRGIGTQDWTDG